MSSPREGTEFCRQYYYLAIALPRINSMLKKKLLKIYMSKKKNAQNLIYIFD